MKISKLAKATISTSLIGCMALSPIAGESLSSNHSIEAKDQTIKIDNTLANIVASNVVKDKNGMLVIKDKAQLKNQLSNYKSKVTVAEVEKYVKNYNDTITGKKGKKAQQDLQAFNKQLEDQLHKSNQSGQVMRSKCSTAIGVTGFAHTTAVTGAALALGASGPVGWGIGVGMGAAYLGGSMLC